MSAVLRCLSLKSNHDPSHVLVSASCVEVIHVLLYLSSILYEPSENEKRIFLQCEASQLSEELDILK